MQETVNRVEEKICCQGIKTCQADLQVFLYNTVPMIKTVISVIGYDNHTPVIPPR